MSNSTKDHVQSLVNTGFVFGNEGRNGPSVACTVVLGGARSGTSLIAGAMHHLGVFMGEKASPPVFEDLRLSRALEDRKSDRIRATVREYAANHRQWGFKRPGAIDYFDRLEEALPARRYICIFRDIFATANRNRLSVGLDMIKGLDRALQDNESLVRCVRSTSSSWMLCSYEKILQRPREFIDALIAYAHLDVGEDAQRRALKFIRPDPVDYLDSSRNTRAVGKLERVSANQVAGWVKYVNRDTDPVVELFVNGNLVERQKAVSPRPDIKESGRHPTGRCGFEFRLKDELKSGDRVDVRVTDEIRNLNPDPVTFQP